MHCQKLDSLDYIFVAVSSGLALLTQLNEVGSDSFGIAWNIS